MIGTIIQRDLHVNNVVACKYTGEHCALDTLVNSRDIFLRNRTADNCVDELVALTRVRLNTDLNVTVLALTAGLTSVLHIGIRILADRLFVSNLRLTDVSLNLKLTHQTVNDDLQMELTHAGDDGLAGFFIGIALKVGSSSASFASAMPIFS